MYKLFCAAAAALLSLLVHVPVTLHKTAGVALWFIVADTGLGLVCARMSGEMTSSAFRKKLNSKLVCYAGTLALASGMAITAGSYSWLIAGWYAVMAAEGLSIAENLRGIVKSGGPALAPVAALLDKISAILQPKGGSDSSGDNSSSSGSGSASAH